MIAYLKLFRLPLVFTAIADSLAGFLSLWARFPLPTWDIFACLAVTSAGLYCFGMAMNDIADRDRDKTLAPGRPLPSGRISLRGALIAAIASLVLSLLALSLVREVSGAAFVAWGATVAGILLYDFGVKIPPVMGSIRACNFLIGALAWDTNVDLFYAAYVWPAVGLFVYGTSLTFVSTLEDVALRKGVLWAGAIGMVVGALIPASAATYEPLMVPIWPTFGPAGLLVVWVLMRAAHAKDKKGVMLMVRDGVAGFILLDASIVMRFQEPGLGLAIAALLIPAFGLMQVFKRLA